MENRKIKQPELSIQDLLYRKDKEDRKDTKDTKVMENSLIIRPARAEDTEAMRAIYAPYVENTAITFEARVPSQKEFLERFLKVTEKYPWIVAVEDERIIGYMYVSAFKERAAYDWSVETSIYVDQAWKGKGTGKYLIQVMETLLKKMGITNANACIAVPAKESRYLDEGSMYFHEKMGYKLAGRFHLCASKYGEWFDMIWMEKPLLEHPQNPAPVKTWPEIKDGLDAILAEEHLWQN